MATIRERRGAVTQGMRRKLQLYIGLGRTAILLMLIASLFNQLMLLLNVDYHFMLSASVPYYLSRLAQEQGGASSVTLLKLFAIFVTMLTFFAYVACWILSAQRRDLLKAAFWMYCVDTGLLVIVAFTLVEYPLDCLLELLVHLAVAAVLYNADRSAQQLRKMTKKKRPRPAPRTPKQEPMDPYN